MQLELFPQSIEDTQEHRIQKMEEKYDTLRKSVHARISPLQKRINELERELEFLKGHICKKGLFL